MKKTLFLDEKIYLLTFSEPKYKSEIMRLIYGKKGNVKIYGRIDKLERRGWVRKTKIKTKIKRGEKKDKRAKRRIYFEATSKPVIDEIEKRVNSINDFDKYILKKILDSLSFRYLLKQVVSKNFKNIISNPIEFILSALDGLIITTEENKIIQQLSQGIEAEKQYDNAIQKIKNEIETLKIQKPELIESSVQQSDVSLEILEDFPCILIIPDSLLHKIRGISEFGRTYFEMKNISNTIKIFKQ